MGMLKNGVPSEATLCRVENGIDDLAMADRCISVIGISQLIFNLLYGR